MEKVLRFCVDGGDSTIVLFTIDTWCFYKFCGFKKRRAKAGKELGGVSCKFGLLSVAIEQRCCSGTGNARIAI